MGLAVSLVLFALLFGACWFVLWTCGLARLPLVRDVLAGRPSSRKRSEGSSRRERGAAERERGAVERERGAVEREEVEREGEFMPPAV